MVRFILFLFVMSTALNFASAADTISESEFRKNIELLDVGSKAGLTVLNSAFLIWDCPVRGGLTAVSAVADTVPIASAVNDILVTVVSEDYNALGYQIDHGGGLNTYVVGGALMGLVAMGQSLFDFASSGEFDSQEQYLKELAIVYHTTSLTYERSFGEGGYCRNTWKRLGIILGLR